MEQQQDDIWRHICKRAGIEREPSEVGPPTGIPLGILFAWYPTKDDPNTASTTCPLPHATKPTVFEVGKAIPLKKAFLCVALFEDDTEVRVYGLPEKPSQAPAENIPLRWTFPKASSTMFVAQFLDPNTFIDSLAAEIVAAESEFEGLEEESDESDAGAAISLDRNPPTVIATESVAPVLTP